MLGVGVGFPSPPVGLLPGRLHKMPPLTRFQPEVLRARFMVSEVGRAKIEPFPPLGARF